VRGNSALFQRSRQYGIFIEELPWLSCLDPPKPTVNVCSFTSHESPVTSHEPRMPKKFASSASPWTSAEPPRAVDMGPSAPLRGAGLQASIKRWPSGRRHRQSSVNNAKRCPVAKSAAKYLARNCWRQQRCRRRCRTILNEGFHPAGSGGDPFHRPQRGPGVSPNISAGKKAIGLPLVDAHGDMNTPESSPRENVHGNPSPQSWLRRARARRSYADSRPKAEPGQHSLVWRSRLRQDAKSSKNPGLHFFTNAATLTSAACAKSCPTRSQGRHRTTPPGSPSASIWNFVIPPTLPGSALPSRRPRNYREATSSHGTDRRHRGHGFIRSREIKPSRRTQPHRPSSACKSSSRPRPESPVNSFNSFSRH